MKTRNALMYGIGTAFALAGLGALPAHATEATADASPGVEPQVVVTTKAASTRGGSGMFRVAVAPRPSTPAAKEAASAR